MSEPVNPHSPILAGASVTVPAAGTLVVDTGLREVHSFSVCAAEPLALGFVNVTAELSADKTKLTLKTWKATLATDATPILATTARKVCWSAVGK